MRFAVLSNILPPSPSGQSVVLYRLLNTLPSDQYFFISSEPDTATTIASSRLPVPYYHMGPPPRRQWASALDMAQRAYRRLTGRAIENLIHLRARQISEIIQREPCCALIACTSDFMNLPAAAIVCAKHSIAFVPYIFDDYAFHLTGWQRDEMQGHVQKVMSQAAQVIVTNEATEDEYKRRYHISNISVIHNLAPIPDLNSFQIHTPFLDKSTFNIVYSGAVYRAHYDAFRNLIQAIETLPQNTAKLHLFTDQSAAEIAAEGISGDCLVHHPHVHQSEIASALLEADLLFLPLAFESPIQEVLRLASPGKMGDYLAMAKPILVHAPADTFICQYFRRYECGVVVDKPDIALLAAMILEVIAGKIDVQRLAQRARQRAEADFAVEHVRSRFLESIHKVCESSI